MEKKTIVKLSVAAVILIAAIVFGSGLTNGGDITYQLPGPYTAESTNNFSTVNVAATVKDGKITECTITSSGDSDLLTDATRAEWAQSIVDNQTAENDVISGATLVYSAASVQEATNDILVQAGLKEPGEAPAEAEPAEPAPAEVEAEPAQTEAEPAEAEPAEAAAYQDGTYTVQKDTGFSTVTVEITVEGGKVAKAAVTSEGDNDLLTDDQRSGWADQIVAKQSVDAISGVTVSSTAVQEAVAELLAQASGEGEAPAEPAPAEAETKPAEPEAAAYKDGTYTVQKDTGFSTVTVEITVEGGKVAKATVTSEGANDLLTDDQRSGWADQIVAKQSVDAISGVTVSSTAVQEAVAELLAQASGEGEAPAEPAPAEAETKPAEPEAEPAEAAEADAARMAEILPQIVVSMGANKDNSYVIDYLEQDPYLVTIYEGYGFAKDYGSARGHEYTLEDVAKTQRPHPKANCITCKTPDLHKMIEEQGVAVYSMPFDEVMPQMKQNVSCYSCHGADNGNDGALAVTHQYVNEALGDNVSTIDASVLSCGQCHIEYYFTPEDSEAMMPYHSVEEMTPEAILAYYDALDFADWTQESTGTRLLKAQHPEMETFLQGKHAALLSCADCHMPTETTEGGTEYRSHFLVSPLENEALLNSCAKCHGSTDMVEYVHGIQANVTARETEVGNKLAGLKEALAAAVTEGKMSEDELNAVHKLHREAQWFFDFSYVENSEGAHNSALDLHCLEVADGKIDEAMTLLNP